MLLQDGRSGAGVSPTLAGDWRMERLTPPSRLFGANGLRTGPDGRIYIAQVTGSQVSALDIGNGQLETISPKGGDIIAPDDVAFGPRGELIATEVMDGRVSVRDAGGHTRVLRGDVPSANGITVHQGRLFIGECRDGGRLLELDLDGGEPRVLLDNVPSPNAMEVGPDGLLYFPVMGANEIWRVDLDGGVAETVAAGLGVPDSVKFDSAGRIVSTQVHSGQVLRIDPRNGEQTVLADLNPGLDNLTFVGDRLFVSNFTGEITEILAGRATRTVLAGGLNWPLDLAVGSDGNLYIADGTYFYVLLPDHTLQTVGMLFTAGYPGFVRGVAPAGPGEFVVTTSGGQVSRYRPASGESDVLADGFDQLYGVAIADDGRVAAAELGTGRVLSIQSGRVEVIASGLNDPIGVAIAPDGGWLVSEAGAGRVVKLTGSGAHPVVAELGRPQGILVDGRQLFIVDAGARALVALDLEDSTRRTIAAGLPLGAAPGVVPKPLKGMPPFSGPQGPFAGIAAASDGTLYVSADADGSVLAFRREHRDG
ncbi:MAG TPA: SMP-30/gluconolactonase/LRE family protein [Mycobacterium sp.]|uniref:SMP-30/gluconolactonase/LRE family protein n=1 Tax=Mycobacterium sp. TaxID=1785 RepID=UPI002F416555